MSRKTTLRIPAIALEELKLLEEGCDEFTVDFLLDLVNQAAKRFLPVTKAMDGRRKEGFTIRTLRHYQTLGCLDSPEKDGRTAIYRFRHYLQALVVRKLLFEGFSAEQIKDLMGNQTTAGLYELLLKNVEMEGSRGRRLIDDTVGGGERPVPEPWIELKLNPEFTLKVRGSYSSLTGRDTKQLLKRALKAIQSHLD